MIDDKTRADWLDKVKKDVWALEDADASVKVYLVRNTAKISYD